MQAVKKILRPFTSGFNHRKAQTYETTSSRRTMRKYFAHVYKEREADRAKGGLWLDASEWFNNDQQALNDFIAYVRDRNCLEIGSGPFGVVPLCDWMTKRIVIDPLANFYRDEQLRILGKTFFTDDLRRLAIPAEESVAELKGKIDGAIVCRNAIDHTEDPLMVLNNIADYAASGCYFLFWTDIWHIEGLDEGHRNITRSPAIMERLLDGMGFDVLWQHPVVRDPKDYIEFGCLARKR
jgi:hypothetical protein